MTFFDQIYNLLFVSDKPLQVKETLERTRHEKITFARWQQHTNTKPLLEKIFKNYHYQKSGINSKQMDIHILQSVGANGLAIMQDKNFDKYTLICVMEFLKTKILSKRYTLQSAERHVTEKNFTQKNNNENATFSQNSFVETLERYYFKPDIHAQAMAGEICDQQYGNITLEYIKTDNTPQYLKILVTFYQDRLFTPALPFDDFLKEVFLGE